MYGLGFHVGDEWFGQSEALYQLLRLPGHPEVQREIQAARGGMAAKIVAYRHKESFRPDWLSVKINCMRFALWHKIAEPANRKILLELLRRREGRPIVEVSYKDDRWGAVPQHDGTLVGMNILGRLWMEIGMKLDEDPEFPRRHALPEIPNLMMFGKRVPHPYSFAAKVQ